MVDWGIEATVCGKRVAATAVGVFNIAPRHIWDILTFPEGAEIFRVEGRQLLSDDGMGNWEEQVVFTAPVRILFWKPTTRSCVHQLINASVPGRITVQFMLLQSDLMSHLSGQWVLEQLPSTAAADSLVTRVTYSFQMWPRGVPTALRFMPGLLDAVKGAVKREAAQLFDKVYYVAQKVEAGLSVVDALRAATAEIHLSGGSFKLLQQALGTSGLPSNSCCAGIKSAPVSPDVVGCHALLMDEDLESNLSTDDGEINNSCDDLALDSSDVSSSFDGSAVAVNAVINAVEVADAVPGPSRDCSRDTSKWISVDSVHNAALTGSAHGKEAACTGGAEAESLRNSGGSDFLLIGKAVARRTDDRQELCRVSKNVTVADDTALDSKHPAVMEAHQALFVKCSSNSSSTTAVGSVAAADIDANVLIGSCPMARLGAVRKQHVPAAAAAAR